MNRLKTEFFSVYLNGIYLLLSCVTHIHTRAPNTYYLKWKGMRLLLPNHISKRISGFHTHKPSVWEPTNVQSVFNRKGHSINFSMAHSLRNTPYKNLWTTMKWRQRTSIEMYITLNSDHCRMCIAVEGCAKFQTPPKTKFDSVSVSTSSPMCMSFVYIIIYFYDSWLSQTAFNN